MEIIKKEPDLNIKTFHIDGRDCGRRGTGSIYGWIRIETGVRHVCVVPPLTEHEAEYEALLAVLKYLARGSRATIYTHSSEIRTNFNDPLVTPDQEITELFAEARELIREKKLKIRVRYIDPEDNRAVLQIPKQRRTGWRQPGTKRRR
jgi:ribonuclease HI